MSSFRELGVHADIIKSLEELNISNPSEIQKSAIPLLLNSHKDFIGQAQTGSGKTIAFAIPILQNVDHESKEIQALILAPTRELCKQIAKQIFRCTKYTVKIFAESVYGGEKIEKQITSLKRPTQILVATPGRLIDLLERKALSLNHVKILVLDEADEMFSMGFKDQISAIIEKINPKRKIWLFSATIPKAISALINKYLSPDPLTVKIRVDEKINARIEHQYLMCGAENKYKYLTNFLKFQGDLRGIVFCKTKANVKMLQNKLIETGMNALAIHGDLNQKERDKTMRMFRNESAQILVATDISARGIDVNDLAYVAHYELPDQLDYYTHRSGRTARAGKKGISLAFVHSSEVKHLRVIEKKLNIRFRNIG